MMLDISPEGAATAVGRDDGLVAFRARLAGTNINQETLLATDYLNHFNEIIMLIEMIPDMTDCLEDAKAWEPKTYQQHFIDSSIADGKLAAEAYDYCPPVYRQPFDRIVAALDNAVAAGLRLIEQMIATGDPDQLRMTCEMATRALRRLADSANAVIHGQQYALSQDEIDSIMPSAIAGHT